MKIFILEDNERRITSFKRKFKNVSLFIAKNYKEAKSILSKNKSFDLISLDHDIMEEKTGLDVSRLIKKNKIKAKNIIIHSQNVVGAENMRAELSVGYNVVKIPFGKEYLQSIELPEQTVLNKIDPRKIDVKTMALIESFKDIDSDKKKLRRAIINCNNKNSFKTVLKELNLSKKETNDLIFEMKSDIIFKSFKFYDKLNKKKAIKKLKENKSVLLKKLLKEYSFKLEEKELILESIESVFKKMDLWEREEHKINKRQIKFERSISCLNFGKK
jgi:CheY-like chemotaxis protein